MHSAQWISEYSGEKPKFCSQTNPHPVSKFQKDGWEFSREDNRLLFILTSEGCQSVLRQTLCLRAGDFLPRSYRLPHSTTSNHAAGSIHSSAITVLLQYCLPTAFHIPELLKRRYSAPTS